MKRVRDQLRKYSLRTQMIIAFLLIALPAMGLLTVLYTRAMRTALIGQANQALFAAASQTVTSLDDFINANLENIRTETTLPGIVSYMGLPASQRAGSDEEKVALEVLDALHNKDLFYIASYALLDVHGKSLLDTVESDIGQDESDRDYFRQPLQNGRPYVSPVTFAQDVGGVYFYFSSPVRNSLGQIVGVLRVRYSVALLQELVLESRGLAGDASHAILLDENYLRLAHDTAPELVFRSVSALEPARIEELRTENRLPNLPITELSTDLLPFQQGLDDHERQPFFVAEAHREGHIEQVAVVALESQPWLISYVQSQEVFLSPVDSAIRVALLWIIMFVGLIVLAAIVMAQWLAGPITHLTTVAGQVAAGELTARAHVDSDDEIGQLALAFNHMTTQLQHTLVDKERRNEQLHQEVTERMRAEEALQESNHQLEEAVTELKDTQAQMVQQERLAAVGQLAAGIAHDFNNIMATVILHSELILRTSELSPKQHHRVTVIQQQGQRAADLTQQILDFSRKSMMERQNIDVYSFLVEIVELLTRTLPENIQFVLNSNADECIIYADPTRIQQVIMNLVINARNAMPDGGELCVSLARMQVGNEEKRPFSEIEPGEWIRITISDTGKGIADDALPHIFEPFFTTRAPLGSGLGLSQVYGIVKQHGGHIAVASEVGIGTTFTLYLPAVQILKSESVVEDVQTLFQGCGENVLVVEDNDHIREALIDSLEMLNYRVFSAVNGREALALYEQEGDQIDLLLCDLVMPEMGGRELIHILKQRDDTLKVVILTGYPLADPTIELKSAGAIGWMQKPITLEVLSQTVAHAMGE